MTGIDIAKEDTMPSSRFGRSSRATLIPGNGPLARVPPAAVFGLVLLMFLLGVVLRGVIGIVLLGLLGVGLVVLLAATWRVLRPSERVLRVVILLILAAVAASLLR
ncbi:MAG TPA: hypothetical protein VG317_08370 [Pseudonocardiaceae bacterium]|nr:hypothetical protein [Pseudonocardiaceae bacterium]